MPRSRAVLPRPAGGVTSHITAVTTTISTTTDDEALPEKNRVAERDDAARDHAVVGDDLADLRLQRSRRGHLQRSRSAQALRPDAAEAEEAGGGERAIVDALDAARDFSREHGAEDEAEAPVEPRARHGEERHERDGVARRRRPRRNSANDSAHRLRGREHVPGDDDERHLQREWDQLPETASPGIDHLRQARRRKRDAGDDHDQGGEEREDEGIGHPPLGPIGQRERHAREDSRFRRRVRIFCGTRVRTLHRESALERNVERCAGLGADVVHRDARMQLGEDEPAALFHFEHAQIGDDEINDAQAGDRQRALFQNLRAAVLGRVLHHRHDALHSGDEIHRATGPFDHLAGNHPIRDVAFVRHLECAENGEIDVAAANHGERIGAGEKGRAGHRRDGLLAGVDQVGVHLVFGRKRADAEQAVLGLQRDVHAFGNVIGHQRRDADAEIDVVAVAQFLRGALRHQLADRDFLFSPPRCLARCGTRCAFRSSRPG